MKVWKLISHHSQDKRTSAIHWSVESKRIALGWGKIGDLRELSPGNPDDIRSAIAAKYKSHHENNWRHGDQSLRNLFQRMNIGDLVILVGPRSQRVHVVKVTGNYCWSSAADAFDEEYLHQRSVIVTSNDPDELWERVGGKIAPGQDPQLALALCSLR